MTDGLHIAEPAGGWFEPWPRLFELTKALPIDRWALVGGLMVQAHALAAAVETTRVTTDVDAAVRVEMGAFSYTQAAASLTKLGYTIDESTRFAYRFQRGNEIVDLMVPDHQRPTPRHRRRDVMQVGGGHQAMSRLTTIRIIAGGAEHRVPLPDLHAALVVKSAAYTADSRDRDRHLVDAVTLLACIVDTESIISGLAGSDRRRILALIRALDQKALIYAQVPSDTAALAQRTIDEFRLALASK